ncbi:damage-inducible protein, partial [Chromatium okenii]|uniref:type ISP restriction/modification enzyme n=1 Tax=Chromatium okenii TaxID=61644 RepID=UPI0030840ADE|nr:damage-inducible protein [Chromatium okenii]
HSGLISPEQLPFKYQYEIHANEIVLLAYYIAAINIESSYHSLVGGNYQPFGGICLTDTFQLYEKGDLLDELLAENSSRRHKQKQLPVRVIIGNPPYSAGQASANDDAANLEYKGLDKRIAETYIAKSQGKGGKRSAYDSYIRAIRWASDRIGDSGIIGFVTNAGWLESNSADGLRQCLAEEFSSIYIFHLRGNQRTAGELSRKEGGKIFGGGSRAPIAILLLVKNPNAAQHGQIYVHDVGDYLSREEKLDKINAFVSVAGITANNAWQSVIPDQHSDWLNQRTTGFSSFILLGTKKSTEETTLFSFFSSGIVSGRDNWVYSFAKTQLITRCRQMIDFYNAEIERYKEYINNSGTEIDVQIFVEKDLTRISWGGGNWQARFKKFQKEKFVQELIRPSLYRPFTKMWHYGGVTFNHSFYSMPRVFPDATAENIVICVTGFGESTGFSNLIADKILNFHFIAGFQCFPRYLYDEPAPATGDANLFATESTRTRRDAITDAGLNHFQTAYPDATLNKEDLFYYIYGLLHSPDYRERYKDNLSKELPRIPRVKTAADFWAFSTAGRQLAALHLNYETVTPYPLTIESSKPLTAADYRVTKMKYGKCGKEKDLTTVIYNDFITLREIPLEAYQYVVNGKPALDWVIERQSVKIDKDSGIVNDANDWAHETMNNPRYPLELFQRVVTVSLETLAIVKGLPKLE